MFLTAKERMKSLKYAAACLELRGSFTPLALSADGVYGQRADRFIHVLAERMKKEGEPIAPKLSYIRSRLAVALVRATSMCIRGSRSQRRHNMVDFSDGGGRDITLALD